MVATLFNEYTFLLWWVALMAVVSQFADVTTMLDVLGQRERRVNLVFAVIVFFPIFRLAAFGPLLGDVWAYISSFNRMTARFGDVFTAIREHESGFGYNIIDILIKCISGDDTVYRVTIALIHSIPVVLILRRYSEDYFLSVFLFVAGTYHIAWMMNGLRQFVAVVIIFSAFPLLLQKRYIPMILVVLVAATVHTSALMMLPVIFVVQGKAWNWKTLLSILVAVAATLVFNRNVELFNVLVENTEYEGAVSAWRALGDDGVNPIRVLVNAIPMLLALLGRRLLPQDDAIINVCVNMSVVTTGIYLVGMVTSGVMVGRLPVYTGIYSLILYPSLIRHIFSENSQRIIRIIMICWYLAYYVYSMS